jgi:hypothetical protein
MLECKAVIMTSVGPVKGALGNLDYERGVGEGQSLEICSILTNAVVRLDNESHRGWENAQEWEHRRQ